MCKVAIEQCYVIRLVKMMYLFFSVCSCAQITTDNIHSCLARLIGTKIHAQHVDKQLSMNNFLNAAFLTLCVPGCFNDVLP